MRRLSSLPLLALAVLVVLGACADRPRRNPLDPEASDPLDLADPLEAYAGDQVVRLRWDFTGFDDVESVRLYRDDGGGTVVTDRPATDTAWVDTGLTNGRRYSYRLGLRVRDAGELAIAGAALATPGPERAWVADAGTGLVWRLTPDGRRGLFARGRFVGIAGLAVDTETGAAWVTDARLGLHRVDSTGEVRRWETPFTAGGEVVAHGRGRRGWVADAEGGAVLGFALDADSGPMQPADAVFAGPVLLAASPDGGVWVGDPRAQRVLRFADNGTRLDEWRELSGLRDVAAGPRCCQSWALIDDGAGLARLAPGEAVWRVSSPVAGAVALSVDDSGVTWVVGEGTMASIDGDGVLLDRYTDGPAGALTLVAAAGDVWVAGTAALWKISGAALTYRTELTGFSRIVEVAVDPGR